jgi:hypothetical protein
VSGVFVLVAASNIDLQPVNRTGSAIILCNFFSNSTVDYSQHIDYLLSALFPRMLDSDTEALTAAWRALGALIESIPKDKQVHYLAEIGRNILRLEDALDDASDTIPGLCVPTKALDPFLPPFLQGVRYGSSEIREQSANSIGDLIRLTSEAALKPYVITITGALLRVIGDRFPAEVKAAILKTMGYVSAHRQ